MTDTLTLYTNPQSRGRIARWIMEEAGQPYSVRVLDYGPQMKSAAYLALNPMGKVPTLTHGDKVVTEGAAICAYMAETFPGAGLLPEDRAAYYRWLFFAAGPVEQAVTNKAMGFEAPAERQRMMGFGHFDLMVSTLEHAVSQSAHVAGDRFSAADVYVGSQIGWGLAFGTLPDTPALRAYWDRIKDRPARLRADAADNALIAKATQND